MAVQEVGAASKFSQGEERSTIILLTCSARTTELVSRSQTPACRESLATRD